MPAHSSGQRIQNQRPIVCSHMVSNDQHWTARNFILRANDTRRSQQPDQRLGHKLQKRSAQHLHWPRPRPSQIRQRPFFLHTRNHSLRRRILNNLRLSPSLLTQWLATHNRNSTNHPPQLTQRLYLRNRIIADLDTQPALQQRLQLHARQAVETQILAQPRLVTHLARRLARHLRDHLQQHLLRLGDRTIPPRCRTPPRRPLPANQLARRCIRERRIRPAHEPTHLLKLRQRRI